MNDSHSPSPVDRALSSLRSGDFGTVKTFLGGPDLRKKFLELGLLPGTRIEVVSGRPGHPFLVKLNESRIMIGGSMSEFLILETNSTASD